MFYKMIRDFWSPTDAPFAAIWRLHARRVIFAVRRIYRVPLSDANERDELWLFLHCFAKPSPAVGLFSDALRWLSIFCSSNARYLRAKVRRDIFSPLRVPLAWFRFARENCITYLFRASVCLSELNIKISKYRGNRMKSFYVHFYRCKLTLTECLLLRKTWNLQGIFFHDLSNILFNLGLTYIFFIFFLIFKTKKR